MDGLDVTFMRLQTFQNNDQYMQFMGEVKTFEKYKEQIIKNVTQYYAQIQFSFLNYIPLNILINGIKYKYLDIQKIQIKDISIAILEHYLQLQKQQFHHGNIQSQNIIVEFQQKQNSDQSTNGIQLYFTNYSLEKREGNEKQKKREEDEKIKREILKLLDLIDSDYPNVFNNIDKIEEILNEIKQINIQTNGWKNKLQNLIPWKGNGQIKTLSQKIKEEYPKLNENMIEQIKQFNNKQNSENCDSLQQNQEEFQTTNQVNETHNQNQQQNNEQQQRIEVDKKWQNLIQDQQAKFFEKLKEFFLLQFVENVISYKFNPDHVKQKNKLYEKDQVKQGNNIEDIIDKCYLDATVSFETLLKYFNGIQTTFQEEWKRISDDHFSNYKFDFDLEFKDLVKQHFNEFFSQNSNYISDKKQIADGNMEMQQKLIIQQFSEKYDYWISYKILDLISSLI